MVTNPVAIMRRENARLQAENEQLQEELRNLREFVQILNDLTRATRSITSDAELLPLLDDIFTRALNLLNAPDGSLMLLDDETDEMVFVLVRGVLAANLRGYRIPAGEGIAGWVIKNAQPTLVRDVRRDPRFSYTIDEQFTFHTQSIAAAPLIGDRRVYGVIEVLNKPGDEPFDDSDLALLGLLCRFAGEALADIERLNPEKTG
ncbi:MAG: GAF domain-containing protein [Chloroflexi bacterium]|nr:GAF domain-containing protein [Chloroflexota bacterium]MDL1885804.1 GAF domain-containing protein [Anaerolineae bacterium CFX8]